MRKTLNHFLWDKTCPYCGSEIEPDSSHEAIRCKSCGTLVEIDFSKLMKRGAIYGLIALVVADVISSMWVAIFGMGILLFLELYKGLRWKLAQRA
jgi:transcription elongation factor Elf1